MCTIAANCKVVLGVLLLPTPQEWSGVLCFPDLRKAKYHFPMHLKKWHIFISFHFFMQIKVAEKETDIERHCFFLYLMFVKALMILQK